MVIHTVRVATFFVTAILISSSVATAQHFMTPFDTIPDFGASPTISSVKSGSWSDATLWNTGVIPTATDVVLVKHNVSYDSSTASVRTLAIDAGGSWSCSTVKSTKLLVGTFLAKPGSRIECGSASAPLPATLTADIVIRDVAPQTSAGAGVFDPSQYGTGLIAIAASVRLYGAPLSRTFVRLAAEPLAGSRTLRLAEPPQGWRPGDDIVVPDTRQLTSGELAPRPENPATAPNSIRRISSQSETVRIQSIDGTAVALESPLQFDHKGARNPDGVLELLPHVGNLSRNITIRSENPSGTRGHVLLTRAVDVDIRHVGFRSLGRTTSEVLDSTTFDANGTVTRVGTNQIGRYPLHVHHVPGVCPAKDYQFTLIGNAIADGRKWAMTVHGSHYGLVQDNVIFDATGAGIATEDGSETGNRFERNFIAKVEASIRLLNGELADPFGRKGNGFWFRGPNNILRGNVIADTREGIGYYSGSAESGGNSNGIAVRVPLFACADTSVAGQYSPVTLHHLSNPDVSDNEIYSTSQMAMGTWFYHQTESVSRVPIRNTTIWHAAGLGLFLQYWNGSFQGLRMLNEGGVGIAIQQFNDDGTNAHSEMRQADVQGFERVYEKSGQLTLPASWLIQDSKFRNRIGFHLNSTGQFNHTGGSKFVFRNVVFSALPGVPMNAFALTEAGSPASNDAKTFLVYGYQGNANDNFRLYYTSQAADAPGGMRYGAVAPCTTTRQEIFGGFACPISGTSVGSVPNARGVAPQK